MEEYVDCECGNKIKKPGRGRVPKVCRQCRLKREAETRDRTRTRTPREPHHNKKGE